MPLYRAERHITHGQKVCPTGTVIELDADEPKSDGFVLVEAPKKAKAEHVEPSAPEQDAPVKPASENKKHR